MAFNSLSPRQSRTPVVLNLIIINAIVFLAQQVFDQTNGEAAWLTNRLALWGPGTGLFSPYQLVTHMFTHANFFHILFNMYALWIFGAVLERSWGPVKFLVFYLACGLGAALAQIFLQPVGAAVGASGAVMGLLAGFAYSYPNVQFYILPIPFPLKAKYLAAIYLLIDLFGGFSGSNDGVAHWAHLGGFVMGLILMIIWIRRSGSRSF